MKHLERNSGSLNILNPSQAVHDALKRVREDNPGILLDWHFEAVSAAVAYAKANTPLLLPWLDGIAYPILVKQLQAVISNTLAKFGGGQQLGNSILASNADYQSNCIFVQARDFMLADPFLATICGAPNCQPIARLYLLGDGHEPMHGAHHPLPLLQLDYGVELFD